GEVGRPGRCRAAGPRGDRRGPSRDRGRRSRARTQVRGLRTATGAAPAGDQEPLRGAHHHPAGPHRARDQLGQPAAAVGAWPRTPATWPPNPVIARWPRTVTITRGREQRRWGVAARPWPRSPQRRRTWPGALVATSTGDHYATTFRTATRRPPAASTGVA